MQVKFEVWSLRASWGTRGASLGTQLRTSKALLGRSGSPQRVLRGSRRNFSEIGMKMVGAEINVFIVNSNENAFVDERKKIARPFETLAPTMENANSGDYICQNWIQLWSIFWWFFCDFFNGAFREDSGWKFGDF